MMHLQYEYDSFSNIRTMQESYAGTDNGTKSFSYDHQNRVILNAYSRQYSWHSSGNMATFEGQSPYLQQPPSPRGGAGQQR